jgi:hypothetical protein
MGKNRFNATPVDYAPKSERQKKVDETLPLQPCIICEKKCEPYAYWAEGQTCSRVCEALKEAQPKLYGGQSCEILSTILLE